MEAAKATAHDRMLCEGALSILLTVAEIGDLVGLRYFLKNFNRRMRTARIPELLARYVALWEIEAKMAAVEARHGQGACLQIDHPLLIEHVRNATPRFTQAKLETARKANIKPSSYGFQSSTFVGAASTPGSASSSLNHVVTMLG